MDEGIVIRAPISQEIVVLESVCIASSRLDLTGEIRGRETCRLRRCQTTQLAAVRGTFFEETTFVHDTNAVWVLPVVVAEQLSPKLMDHRESVVEHLTAQVEGEVASPDAPHQPATARATF